MSHKMSQLDTMACIDDRGRCRCPWCGRFAKLSKMQPIPPSNGDGWHVHHAPHCGCLEEK